MKKYIYCALMALLCIACSKEDDPLMDTPVVIPKTLYAQAPVFESRALVEEQPISWDDSETVDSRTYAVEDEGGKTYTQYWSSGDAISLFLTTANLQYQLQSFKNDSLDVAIFDLAGNETQGTALTTNYYYAVYPYKSSTSINYESGEITYNFPKNQHYAGDSYANGENGMIAREPKETDDKYYFQNFCSYLQLRLYTNENQSKTVKQIVLVANNPDNKMSGIAAINYKGTSPVVKMKMAASNEILLDCGGGIELSKDSIAPTKFWFVLPGDFKFSNGFKITVSFTDNSYIEKSTNKEITIARSHIKPMDAFSPTIEEEDDLIMGPIRYKYNSASVTEPYPLKNEFYGIDGSKLQIINQKYDETTGEWVVYLSGPLGKIGGNCFEQKQPNLAYIIVEDTINNQNITIGDFAFFNCTAEKIELHNNVESIGKSAIKGSTINQFVIDGNVGIINEDAFTGSTRLRTFTATSVDTIMKGAFQMCTNLSTLSIPGLKYVGASAFEDCTSLESINLDSIEKIEDAAFMGCYNLTNVIISSNCTMIGEGAFCNTEMLDTVICYAVSPPFIKTDNPDGSYVFGGASEDLRIYIPSEGYNEYNNPNYFVDHPSEYNPPIKHTTNWWYEEYTGKLHIIQN